jgi:hypothetical protein
VAFFISGLQKTELSIYSFFMDSIKKYEVCKKCLLETDNSGPVKKGELRPNEDHLMDAIKLAVDDIDLNVRCRRLWRNPIDDSKELCEECQYRLEHCVFDDANETNEKGESEKKSLFFKILKKVRGLR